MRFLLWVGGLGLALVGCGDESPMDELGLVTGAVTVCGDGPTVSGIDVSKWQGTIDWAKVAGAGVHFAFIRVSDGTRHIDAKFPANWSGARDNGILRGPYQFFRADEDPVAQADILLEDLATYGKGELPPVIDVESTDGQSPATVAASVGEWISHVEGLLGVAPIIYTGSYFWNGNVASSDFADYPLWHAQWTSAACPNLPSAWSDWAFWQYSASGSIAGISGDVDLDRFNGTLEALATMGYDPECQTDPNGRFCSGDSHLATCTEGVFAEIACALDEHCVSQGGARCELVAPDPEPEPEVVEPSPEVVEPPPDLAEVIDGPDGGTGPDADAHATASRTVRMHRVEPGGGCSGGASNGWLVLLSSIASFGRRERRTA